MVLHEREQCLIAVSGDGTLTVNDLRTGKVCSCSSGTRAIANVSITILCYLAFDDDTQTGTQVNSLS